MRSVRNELDEARSLLEVAYGALDQNNIHAFFYIALAIAKTLIYIATALSLSNSSDA